MKVAVIGSGIAGITTAYFLARAGHEVVIYDKRKYPAMATSYANGGQLSASNAETWNSWRSVKKGVKWLFKEDAPLKINPKINLQKYDWIYRFIKAIPQAESNTLKTCQWALQAPPPFLSSLSSPSSPSSPWAPWTCPQRRPCA